MDTARVDSLMAELASCVNSPREVSPDEPLAVGVDLGTASIVLVVLDKNGQPVACAMENAKVVRDGLVVDYIGATQIMRRLVTKVSGLLGRTLDQAAMAVPPGTGGRESATHRHVIESAGLEVVAELDEPTAANAVLNVENGVIVDIGGGTTGLAVFENGQVTYIADEATGGHHVSLVLAGNYGIDLDAAEELKKDTSRHKEILPVVRPVVQKIGSIMSRHLTDHTIDCVYLAGGTSCLSGIETILAQETGFTVRKPANPLLVTPLGIALNCPVSGVKAD